MHLRNDFTVIIWNYYRNWLPPTLQHGNKRYETYLFKGSSICLMAVTLPHSDYRVIRWPFRVLFFYLDFYELYWSVANYMAINMKRQELYPKTELNKEICEKVQSWVLHSLQLERIIFLMDFYPSRLLFLAKTRYISSQKCYLRSLLSRPILPWLPPPFS